MSNISIRRATVADITYVSQHLRPADHEEFVATTGRSPERFMVPALSRVDDVFCGTANGTPAAIFGLELSSDMPAPWMVGTPAIEGIAIGKRMVSQGRALFRQWADLHGPLRNHVFAANTVHIKFIRLLGCEVSDPKPRGALLLPFMEFNYV